MISRFKTYVRYNTIEELFDRQETIIEATKKAINRESNNNYRYEYLDSQIVTTNEGTFVLELIIQKTNI